MKLRMRTRPMTTDDRVFVVEVDREPVGLVRDHARGDGTGYWQPCISDKHIPDGVVFRKVDQSHYGAGDRRRRFESAVLKLVAWHLEHGRPEAEDDPADR